MEADPIGYPDGGNRYQSRGGNPVRSIDPSGLTTKYVGPFIRPVPGSVPGTTKGAEIYFLKQEWEVPSKPFSWGLQGGEAPVMTASSIVYISIWGVSGNKADPDWLTSEICRNPHGEYATRVEQALTYLRLQEAIFETQKQFSSFTMEGFLVTAAIENVAAVTRLAREANAARGPLAGPAGINNVGGPGAADLIIGKGDEFIAGLSRVKPREGWYTVGTHGNQTSFIEWNQATRSRVSLGVEDLIKRMEAGGYQVGSRVPVRLLSCEAGAGGSASLAQQLANRIGANVEASPHWVVPLGNGKVSTVLPNTKSSWTNTWITFTPK